MTDPTTNDDYRALLRGVLEDPADDLPRLVLADWLEESGDAANVTRAFVMRRAVARTATAPYPDGKAALEYTDPNSPDPSQRSRRVVHAPATPGVAWTISRGFVSAVTLTQAAFLGESCGCCDRGYVSDGLNSHWCYECNGIGRTPGLAAAMFGTQPITAVALSSCLPFYAGLRYWWHPEGRHVSPGQEACGIARPLFSRLAGELHSTGERSYAAAADAHADLSRAAVTHGRHVAGLAPLPAAIDAAPAGG